METPDEFDELDDLQGSIYNTTVPDDYQEIPPNLIPDEDIGVTREKEILH